MSSRPLKEAKDKSGQKALNLKSYSRPAEGRPRPTSYEYSLRTYIAISLVHFGQNWEQHDIPPYKVILQ